MKDHKNNHIFCGGLVAPKNLKEGEALSLDLHGRPGDEDNVTLRIENFHIPFGRTLSPRFIDLVEIAAYVYAADQATTRQYQDTDRFGMDWRQRLHFRIPVRDVNFWSSAEVSSALVGVLNFLGDHFFTFDFLKAKNPVEFQDYLTGETPARDTPAFDEIAMFSGGLDSLAGAVESLRRHHRRMAFVTHLPTTKNNRIISELRAELQAMSPAAPPLHIAIEVNKSKDLGKEPTQRVRSFLFACLGATAAHALGMRRLTFFENGVISLNLPLCGQVVGGRATRTTHPRVLAGFSSLFGLAFGHAFEVINPYLEKTKAEVVRVLLDQGASGLIAKSVSCAHTWERKADETHCGHCSQCLDRRLAMLSANAFDHDPKSIYKTDIFTEPLPEKTDRILASTYIERARTMKLLNTETDFMIRYPEVLDALPFVDPTNPDRALRVLFDLYKRHSVEIGDAIRAMMVRYFDDIHNHALPGDCLVRIVTDSSGTAPTPILGARVEETEVNVFRPHRRVWEVRYQSGERFYPKGGDEGCRYLHYLLQHPGQTFDALELENIIHPPPPGEDETVIMGTNRHEAELVISANLADGLEAITPEGIGRLHAEREDLHHRLRLAQEDDEKTEDIKTKIKQIDAFFRSVTNKEGQARVLQGQKTRAEDRIRAAINRALKSIKKEDMNLHAHLKAKIVLRFGVDNIYDPPRGTVWITA